jgi:hypothetical protein|tara:strand:- start:168 stop:308 length:141 start_codon:yes stop_codon:yes gene_type:complete
MDWNVIAKIVEFEAIRNQWYWCDLGALVGNDDVIFTSKMVYLGDVR